MTNFQFGKRICGTERPAHCSLFIFPSGEAQMLRDMTAEEQYRQMAATGRALADSETDLYEKRQLLLAAQHYDVLANRAQQAAERRRSLKRKSG
jgi:hypothetical protein